MAFLLRNHYLGQHHPRSKQDCDTQPFFLSLCVFCPGYRRVEAPLFESTFKVAVPGKFITHVVGDSGAAGSRPIGTKNALHHRARRSRDAYAVFFSCILFVGMTTQFRKMHPMLTCDCREENEVTS